MPREVCGSFCFNSPDYKWLLLYSKVRRLWRGKAALCRLTNTVGPSYLTRYVRSARWTTEQLTARFKSIVMWRSCVFGRQVPDVSENASAHSTLFLDCWTLTVLGDVANQSPNPTASGLAELSVSRTAVRTWNLKRRGCLQVPITGVLYLGSFAGFVRRVASASTSALDGADRLASRPGYFTPAEMIPDTLSIGGSESRHRIVQPAD